MDLVMEAKNVNQQHSSHQLCGLPCKSTALRRSQLLLRKSCRGATWAASNVLTLKMRTIYAAALFDDTGATLDDLREAVTTSRTRNGSRGACSEARTRPQRRLSNPRSASRAPRPQAAAEACVSLSRTRTTLHTRGIGQMRV